MTEPKVRSCLYCQSKRIQTLMSFLIPKCGYYKWIKCLVCNQDFSILVSKGGRVK